MPVTTISIIGCEIKPIQVEPEEPGLLEEIVSDIVVDTISNNVARYIENTVIPSLSANVGGEKHEKIH